MKKLVAMFLTITLVLSVVSACGGKSSSESSSSSASVSSSDTSSQSSSSEDSSSTSSSSSADSSVSSSEASSDTSAISENASFGTYTPSGSRLLPIYNVNTKEKVCALCFDAAWGGDQTENLLAILQQYNVKATFFLVGRWVDEFPDLVKKISDAGHDVMNHSNTHADLATLSREQIIEEIETCNDKVEAITGKRPTLIRMPYGSYNDVSMTAVRDLGMEPIQWNVDSLDWKEDITSDDIYQRITTKTIPGSIILCHNAGAGTPGALPRVIEYLQGQGYKFETVYDMLIKEDYTIDGNGMQKLK